MNNEYICSVDLGGTKILTALMDAHNKIICRVKVATDVEKGKNFIVKCIAESIKDATSQTNLKEEQIKAICLGVPGTVNPRTGVIGVAPNLKIKNFNIKNALQKYFNIPVLIENDVNLGGLGIKIIELKDKVNNMLVVFVGTGIGGAFFFNGQLFRGSTYYAGEIGHIKVAEMGDLDTKPESSTFELLAGRPAIVEYIKKEIGKGKKSILKSVIKKQKIKSKNLADAVSKKDKIAVKSITKASKIIGAVLGSITTLLNIDTIVLGGGVIEAMGDSMLPIIKDSFYAAVLPEPGKYVNIITTKLGDDAALYGGIALVEEFLK
ncbi:MAG: ROK family protein [Ignavibacteriales bacterium]|nr:ROK family protein [Ignavibacteriales bacterium]